MKIRGIILTILYTANLPPIIALTPNEDRYIQYSDDKGTIHTIDLLQNSDRSLVSISVANKYFLYTRKNPSTAQILTQGYVDSIKLSNFNPNTTTIVVVHGWQGSQNSELNSIVTTAALNHDDVNVIVVDWSNIADMEYISAIIGVPAVGRAVGTFISFLNEEVGAPLCYVHLVGHSLGAHVVGNAGRQLQGKAARITGLDPAGPLWYVNPSRLRSSDAEYVEAIHTCAGRLGMYANIGDTDFYPNGGISQPGCKNDSCNHAFSYKLFGASLTYNNFVGNKCSSQLSMTIDVCKIGSLNMGNDELNKTGSGIFRLQTRAEYPYFLK